MEVFPDAIANLCINKYNSLKKTGKAAENEWTVLAGIILKNSKDILSLVSLATGTKCLGGEELKNSNLYEIGNRLSDSHAEILARRAFLRYLYDQIDLVLNSSNSDVFVKNINEQIEMKPGLSFHLYCSQTPCGDCSIIPMSNDETYHPLPTKKLKGETKNDADENGSVIMKENTGISDVHRTGAKCLSTEIKRDLHLSGIEYHVTGPLRTKPGRGDPTLSLSCSDKMAKYVNQNFLINLLRIFVIS